MKKETELKLQKLKERIASLESAVVAYSGGVDSTFLLKVASDVLEKDRLIAVTARSSTFPEREYKEAVEYIKTIGAKHLVIFSEELDIEGFSKNPVNRCYYCKKELYSKIKVIAEREGLNAVLDGANLDDKGDFRPGQTAARELDVISPLMEAELTKQEIREISKEMGIPTFNKPSFACLSSRFPYGHEITAEKLGMVDKAEQFLLDEGFRQVRVRHHEDIARIEVAAEEREKLFSIDLLDRIGAKLKEIGFKYITVDVLGYRIGSMNEVLTENDKNS